MVKEVFMFSRTVEEGYEKAWFSYVEDGEGLSETLSRLKTVLEEAILSHQTVLIEVFVPQNSHLPFLPAEAALEL